MRRALRLVRNALLATVVLSMLFAMPAAANGPTVTGAGSTWVQIALDQWRADIGKQGYTINYQGLGSGAGRQQFKAGNVDFAATEIPFILSGPDNEAPVTRPFQYLPDVAGGTSLMFNLHSPSGAQITNLKLDAITAARIFTNHLHSWQDPAIQALNPGVTISETNVRVVVRSDPSGTSAQFSLYLSSQAPSVWQPFAASHVCPDPCQTWPNDPPFADARSGSDGVSNFIASDLGAGAIGYVEAGYAFARNFPVASMKNASGNFAQPTAENVALALTHAKLHADLTQDLSDVYIAPEPGVYPMSSYSYMITQTTGFDPAKGYVLGTWILYIACAGQREAKPLGYSPLPKPLVAADFDAVRRIPGAPAPPPLDYAHCANPNLDPHAPPPGSGAHPVSSASTNGTGGSGASAGSAGAGPAAGAASTGTTAGAQVAEAAGIAVLDASHRARLLLDALRVVSRQAPPTWWPLAAAALLLLNLVLLPVVVTLGRAPRAGAPGSEQAQ